MKEEAKDILDSEIFKSKIRIYVIFAIPTLFFAALLALFFPISSNSLEVTAIKFTAAQTDFGNKSIMWAKLDSGATIRISMPTKVEIRQGKKAEIIGTNRLIGITTYKFLRYVD